MIFKSWLCVSIFVLITVVVFTLINQTQPQPYMDEIFHIPQAQKYCQGNFREWDSKITTLPGLYTISVGILNPLKFLYSNSIQNVTKNFCNTFNLRFVNIIMLIGTALILNKLTLQIHGGKHYFDNNKSLLSSMNLAMFPPLFFFAFFYYTDVGSTFFVLLMYCLHLESKNWLASFIGLIAVVFRQTNIIWVGFVGVQTIGPLLLHEVHHHMIKFKKPVKFSLTTFGMIKEIFEGSFLILIDPLRLLKFLLNSLFQVGGYIIVWICFLVFLYWNNGIVVGDKSAHIATFHPTQILYFCAFSLGFNAPFCVEKAKIFLFHCKKHYFLMLGAVILSWVIIDGFSYAHPYLLADNRHYTFYIWRRIIARNEWSKFSLIPLYLFGGFCILHSLGKSNFFFKIFFPLFVFLNLIPQLLLEFRYFLIPYLLYRIQIRPERWLVLISELLIYLFVNIFTISIFILKPFSWDHQPNEIQRIMW